MPTPFRPEPQLPAHAMKTYAIVRKEGLHYRPATCKEVECEQWKNGWITRVPAGSQMDQYLADRAHGRIFSFALMPDGIREYTFRVGQECFRSSQHRVPIEREPFFVVRDGDWRGNPRGTRAVSRTADDWTDDFMEHQAHIADVQQQG